MARSVFTLQSKKPAAITGAQKISKKRKRMLARQKITVCLAAIITIFTVVLSFRVIPYVSDLIALRREQDYINAYGAQMRDINPDYAGLLKINGTTIDYPVVRGNNNEKYLYTTFGGDDNIVGAIFMDYRCAGDYVPHIIIYGHDVADLEGNRLMFGGLREFLDERYRTEHPEIIFMENGNVSVFEIFSARLSDINDPAYYLDFSTSDSFQSFAERNGAPPGATQIITLSTCFGAEDDRRMIVQGVFKRVLPVNTEYSEDGWIIRIQDDTGK